MTSRALTGQRCRSNARVISVSGTVDRHAEGRIRYVVENLGRLLVTIDWDAGGASVLFPDEVDILESA